MLSGMYGLAHGLPAILRCPSLPPPEFDKSPLWGYTLNCTFPNKNALSGGWGTDRGTVSTPVGAARRLPVVYHRRRLPSSPDGAAFSFPDRPPERSNPCISPVPGLQGTARANPVLPSCSRLLLFLPSTCIPAGEIHRLRLLLQRPSTLKHGLRASKKLPIPDTRRRADPASIVNRSDYPGRVAGLS